MKCELCKTEEKELTELTAFYKGEWALNVCAYCRQSLKLGIIQQECSEQLCDVLCDVE